MSRLSEVIYHVCVRLCGRLPIPTGETSFILKNFIHELCVARIGFCQQAAESTGKRVDEGLCDSDGSNVSVEPTQMDQSSLAGGMQALQT